MADPDHYIDFDISVHFHTHYIQQIENVGTVILKLAKWADVGPGSNPTKTRAGYWKLTEFFIYTCIFIA